MRAVLLRTMLQWLGLMIIILYNCTLILSFQNLVEENDLSSEDSDHERNDGAPSSAFLSQLKFLLMFVIIWQFAYNISNAAITNLLHFLKYFMKAVGCTFGCESMQEMGSAIPITLQSLQRLIALQEDDFLNYVVCPKSMRFSL